MKWSIEFYAILSWVDGWNAMKCVVLFAVWDDWCVSGFSMIMVGYARLCEIYARLEEACGSIPLLHIMRDYMVGNLGGKRGTLPMVSIHYYTESG